MKCSENNDPISPEEGAKIFKRKVNTWRKIARLQMNGCIYFIRVHGFFEKLSTQNLLQYPIP